MTAAFISWIVPWRYMVHFQNVCWLHPMVVLEGLIWSDSQSERHVVPTIAPTLFDLFYLPDHRCQYFLPFAFFLLLLYSWSVFLVFQMFLYTSMVFVLPSPFLWLFGIMILNGWLRSTLHSSWAHALTISSWVESVFCVVFSMDFDLCHSGRARFQ